MNNFLTGATGFLGGCLAKKLIERGHEVNALVRNPDKAGLLKESGIKIFPGDITDKESMRSAMKGCDGLFHIACPIKIDLIFLRDRGKGRFTAGNVFIRSNAGAGRCYLFRRQHQSKTGTGI